MVLLSLWYSMSHVPEHVEMFVCTNCQVVHAGSVAEMEDGHQFSAPDRCGACESTEFVATERWAYHGDEQE
ncbi:hypothetical protein HSB1_13340 [Halogranum salarium B-1]|uniref:Small CPxCG-related zinc finger protein n=2 Tax=Halogranum rubrum TaxID=553466 RepID=J3JH71_9EURY|nr:hypothetical protein HSB1_13340 [Halogranum salarium B-1]